MAASVRTLRTAGLLSRTIQELTLKVAVPRCLCTGTHTPPASLRSHVSVTPAAPASTAHTPAPHSSPVTETDDPDVLFQRLTVWVKGHDKAVLDSYEFFVKLAATEFGLTLTKVFEPPRDIERFTLLKSVHIYKKHRVQYEMRTNFRSIQIARVTGSTARVYLEYIQRNLPEGVAMEVTKTSVEKAPEHIRKPLWDQQSEQETSQ